MWYFGSLCSSFEGNWGMDMLIFEKKLAPWIPNSPRHHSPDLKVSLWGWWETLQGERSEVQVFCIGPLLRFPRDQSPNILSHRACPKNVSDGLLVLKVELTSGYHRDSSMLQVSLGGQRVSACPPKEVLTLVRKFKAPQRLPQPSSDSVIRALSSLRNIGTRTQLLIGRTNRKLPMTTIEPRWCSAWFQESALYQNQWNPVGGTAHLSFWLPDL